MATYLGVLGIKGDAGKLLAGPFLNDSTAIPSMSIVYFSSGKLTRCADAASAFTGILIGDAAASAADCMIKPATQDYSFLIGITGTAASLAPGAAYDLDVDGSTHAQKIDQGNTTYKTLVFERLEYEADGTTVKGAWVHFGGTISGSTNQWTG